MYTEKSYKHLLFWLKVKRIFLIFFITIIGAILGGVFSSYFVDILLFNNLSKEKIIIIFSVISFILSNIFTMNISKTIQDGYWRIAALRKLTLISKKLDNLNYLEDLNTYMTNINNIVNSHSVDISNNVPEETDSNEDSQEESDEFIQEKFDESGNIKLEEDTQDANLDSHILELTPDQIATSKNLEYLLDEYNVEPLEKSLKKSTNLLDGQISFYENNTEIEKKKVNKNTYHSSRKKKRGKKSP